jgi:hypothetical protein
MGPLLYSLQLSIHDLLYVLYYIRHSSESIQLTREAWSDLLEAITEYRGCYNGNPYQSLVFCQDALQNESENIPVKCGDKDQWIFETFSFLKDMILMNRIRIEERMGIIKEELLASAMQPSRAYLHLDNDSFWKL